MECSSKTPEKSTDSDWLQYGFIPTVILVELSLSGFCALGAQHCDSRVGKTFTS